MPNATKRPMDEYAKRFRSMCDLTIERITYDMGDDIITLDNDTRHHWMNQKRVKVGGIHRKIIAIAKQHCPGLCKVRDWGDYDRAPMARADDDGPTDHEQVSYHMSICGGVVGIDYTLHYRYEGEQRRFAIDYDPPVAYALRDYCKKNRISPGFIVMYAILCVLDDLGVEGIDGLHAQYAALYKSFRDAARDRKKEG